MNLKIDGKEISLKPLTLNSIQEFEKLTQKKFAKLAQEDVGIGDFITLIWLGVKQVEKDITKEVVGDSIDMSNLKQVQEYLMGGVAVADPTISS